MGNSIKVSQPHSFSAPEILTTPIPWAYSRIFHKHFSVTSWAWWTIPGHQIMEPEYMLSVLLWRRNEEVPKKIGNGICTAVLTLTKIFWFKVSRFLFSPAKRKKKYLLMNFRFRMAVMFCSRFAIPGLYFSFKCHYLKYSWALLLNVRSYSRKILTWMKDEAGAPGRNKTLFLSYKFLVLKNLLLYCCCYCCCLILFLWGIYHGHTDSVSNLLAYFKLLS